MVSRRALRSVSIVFLVLAVSVWSTLPLAAGADRLAAAPLPPAAPAMLPASAAGVAPAALSATDAITLAVLAPLTYGGAPFEMGEYEARGAMLAVKEINAAGGVLGHTRPLTITVDDTSCDQTTAATLAHHVIEQEGARFIVGDACSQSATLVAEVANPAGVLQIAPVATSPSVTVDDAGNVRPYTFRACYLDAYQGRLGAEYALTTLGATRAFVITQPGNRYSGDLSNAFMLQFKAQGQIAGRASYPAPGATVTATVDLIAAAQPDIVYLPSYVDVANQVLANARGRGLTMPFMGGDGWDASQLNVSLAEGSYFVNHWAPEDTRPENQAFIARFVTEFGVQPNAIAALTYDSVQLLAQAMESANSADPTQVKTALAASHFQGVSGALTFDPNHDPIRSAPVRQIVGHVSTFRALVAPVPAPPVLWLPVMRR